MGAIFGPGRPTAALRAINNLTEAQRRFDEWCGFASEPLRQRLMEARSERALYWEYADAATAQARA